MNEIMILLDKLAEKLGTTSTYLWSILLKQAPISAIIDLVMFAFVIICWIIAFKLTKRRDIRNVDWYGVFCFLLLVATIIMIIAIPNIIYGLFNPEIWALNHILKLISK